MRSIPVLVAGGGASGMIAAITAAKHGANVTVIEKKSKPGKKILATGNGHCNFTNRKQESSCYHSSDDAFVWSVLQQFDYKQVLAYFQESGVLAREKDGYYYPLSGQAASVRAMLEREMERYKVDVHCEETVLHIIPKKDLTGQRINGYEVQTDKDSYLARTVIFAVGGKAAPVHGTTGDGYRILEELGVSITPPLPALTSVELSDSCCKLWSGVRVMGQVELWCEHEKVASDYGEIQMVAKGISGIPVFQLSGLAARLLYESKEPYLRLDVMPSYSKEQIEAELLRRCNTYGAGRSLGDILDGMLPDKLAKALLQAVHLNPADASALLQDDKRRIALVEQIKQKKLHIRKVSDFDKAQVTTGGVALHELHASTLELKNSPGLYITGELADVDGICGGYNLQWAWSSGHLAGQSAAQTCQVMRKKYAGK